MQPERELIERERGADAEQDCDDLPARLVDGDAEVAGHEQQDDAGHKMVDVRAAGLHVAHEADAVTRPDRVRDEPHDEECHEERQQDEELRLLAGIDDVVVVEVGDDVVEPAHAGIVRQAGG